MCGRFTLTSDMETLLYRFADIAQIEIDYSPRYNIAPTQPVLSIIADQTSKRMGYLNWGLVPFWAEDQRIGQKMINARAETLDQKPAFKRLLASKRCLILASGFYEWKKENNKKQPIYLYAKDQQPFAFAGLWDRWRLATGDSYYSCTIITTAPNALMQPIHQRMPVILDRSTELAWLEPGHTDPTELLSLLRPCADDYLTAIPVSTFVNNVRNDHPRCIEPLLA